MDGEVNNRTARITQDVKRDRRNRRKRNEQTQQTQTNTDTTDAGDTDERHETDETDKQDGRRRWTQGGGRGQAQGLEGVVGIGGDAQGVI